MFEELVPQNALSKVMTVQSLLSEKSVMARFKDVLGKQTPAFLSAVIAMSNGNLRNCEPKSILASAMMAAILNLNIDSNLGQAWIIPYKSKNGDKAQFQIGYKGFIQLALRSGAYERINAFIVRQGQEVIEDTVTGDVSVIGRPEKWDAPAIGYGAFLKLTSGFEKSVYWPKERVQAHAKRYSKSYSYKDSAWVTNFDEMALKTTIRDILSHYGIMSIEMSRAFSSEDKESEDEVGNWMDIRNDASQKMLDEPTPEKKAKPRKSEAQNLAELGYEEEKKPAEIIDAVAQPDQDDEPDQKELIPGGAYKFSDNHIVKIFAEAWNIDNGATAKTLFEQNKAGKIPDTLTEKQADELANR